jgi:hypothetical protein
MRSTSWIRMVSPSWRLMRSHSWRLMRSPIKISFLEAHEIIFLESHEITFLVAYKITSLEALKVIFLESYEINLLSKRVLLSLGSDSINTWPRHWIYKNKRKNVNGGVFFVVDFYEVLNVKLESESQLLAWNQDRLIDWSSVIRKIWFWLGHGLRESNLF